MEKLKGKIKAIPVKEVTEGMQVLWKHNGRSYILKVKPNNQKYYDDEVNLSYAKTLSKLKTLVVEHDNLFCPESLRKKGLGKIWLPLKYSQWQSAIDNEEVDSDKEVEFELIQVFKNEFTLKQNKSRFEYAKIIPQKKRVYTEEEVKELCKKAFNAGRISKSEALKGNCNFQEDEDWIKKNL